MLRMFIWFYLHVPCGFVAKIENHQQPGNQTSKPSIAKAIVPMGRTREPAEKRHRGINKTCSKNNPLEWAHTNKQHIQTIFWYMTVTKEWMKTLAIRSDFDFKFSGFRVLI